jgi:hypothetical protein
MINTNTEKDLQEKKESESKKPDESSGIYIRGFLKITDPESGETIIETGN